MRLFAAILTTLIIGVSGVSAQNATGGMGYYADLSLAKMSGDDIDDYEDAVDEEISSRMGFRAGIRGSAPVSFGTFDMIYEVGFAMKGFAIDYEEYDEYEGEYIDWEDKSNFNYIELGLYPQFDIGNAFSCEVGPLASIKVSAREEVNSEYYDSNEDIDDANGFLLGYHFGAMMRFSDNITGRFSFNRDFGDAVKDVDAVNSVMAFGIIFNP